MTRRNDDVADFCEQWIERRYEGLATKGLKLGLAMNTFIFAILPLVKSHNAALIYGTHTILEIGLGAWVVGPLRRWVSPRPAVFSLQFFMVACYAVNLYLVIADHAAERFLMLSAAVYAVTCVIFTILNPIHSRRGWIVALLYSGMAAAAVQAHPVFLGFTLVLAFSTGIMALFTRLYDAQSLSEAIGEFHGRQLARISAAIERERDLEFAREIHDALVPALAYDGPRLKIRCAQERHEKVGGDWVALRGAGDAAVIAVADAAGSGVHAALVVQAVQALWARAMAGPLEVPAWLAEVNAVLRILGAKKVQTMTIGVLEVRGGELTYWSAGHVPAYVQLAREDAPSERRSLVAPGPLLGLDPSVQFTPRRLAAPAGATVILGTDGVFAKGTRYSPDELEHLIEAARRDPQAFVAAAPAVDDRSVVVVEVGGPTAVRAA